MIKYGAEKASAYKIVNVTGILERGGEVEERERDLLALNPVVAVNRRNESFCTS